MKNAVINLEDYRTVIDGRKSKVFTGRDRGREVRENSHIDELCSSKDMIKIIIPDDVYSINPSFLEEFLVNVVIRLKEKGKFFEKFHIESVGDYEYEIPFNQAIDRILKKKNALEK